MTFPYHIYSRTEWNARSPDGRLFQPSPKRAFVHHTDSADAAKVETLAQMKAATRAIQDFHMDDRGWDDIAYHFIVFQPGPRHDHAVVMAGRPVSVLPAAQLHNNTATLAIAVYGDGQHQELDRNTRFVIECLIRLGGPSVKAVGGHRDVFATDCPGDRFYAAIPQIAAALGIDRL